jgi:hypothetical protein
LAEKRRRLPLLLNVTQLRTHKTISDAHAKEHFAENTIRSLWDRVAEAQLRWRWGASDGHVFQTVGTLSRLAGF